MVITHEVFSLTTGLALHHTKNHPGKLQTIRKKERKNIKSQEEIEQKKSINLFGEITCFIS